MTPQQTALITALLLAAAGATAQPAFRLQHDPFDWGALQKIEQERTAQAPAIAQAPPQLRAVMRTDTGGRADLDGAILGIGDSAAGYRLLEVRDHSAVFAKAGRKLVIEVGEGGAK